MHKKNKIISAFCAAIVALSLTSNVPVKKFTAETPSNVLAFPGAVGGGSYATGGRGGEVYHVTNLNDSGTGSFRDAVSQSNRIVVFDVSGTIELKSNVLVSSNVTIAGQTAPGGSGITLKNYKLGMSGDNIICRFISSRPGPYKATSSGNDAWGGAKGSNSIIDHCSMSWTTDEQWGLYSNNEYYTVQYSIIGPADSWGGHSKGIHGFGLMMGKGYSTFDHNLIIHNVSRNFRGKVVGTETADFTNNVIYNWAYQTAYGTIGHLNYVGNTLKMGNGTTGGKNYVNVDSSTKPENFGIYLEGNRMLNQDDTIYESITSDNWNGIKVKDGLGITIDSLRSDDAFKTTVNGINVSTALTAESAEDSYEHVLEYAGNGISSSLRTAVDQQAVYETKTGTGNLSGTASYDDADDSQKANLDKYNIQCGVTYEYPSAVLTKTIVDTDNDGMPDDWEIARGLDPNDSSDVNGDYCGQGYTNIEYYINDLTVDAFPEGVVTLSPEIEVTYTSAFETIEAESYNEQSGVKIEDCSEGGQNVGYIENGDYIMFRNIDFDDGAKSFVARISGGSAGIELYLDNMNETPVTTFSVKGTGNWQEWTDVSCNISTITGKHDLYIKFTGDDGYLINMNYFKFSKERITLNGNLIKNLNVLDDANCMNWSISDGLKNGTLIFGDREFTYIDVPDSLVGAEIIQSACDSKNFTNILGTFKAGTDINVYIALDSRVATVPEWLNEWEKSGLSLKSSNAVEFVLYRKKVKSGETVTLGVNGQSSGCVGYSVIVTDEIVQGDVNADGVLSVADIVAMQKYILNSGTINNWKAGDLYEDGRIDVFDLCLMRQMLI